MATRMILLGAAAALAVGSLVGAPSAAAKPCPWGTSPSSFEGVCKPSSTAGGVAIPPNSAGDLRIDTTPGTLGSVNGIPCTPEHYGTCYGMIQNGQ